MLMVPSRPGFIDTVPSHSTTSSAGTTITASSTTHTKGSWTQMVSDTGGRSLGIAIWLDNTATSNTNTSMLVDIGIGGAGSETVLIPDLAAGYALNPSVANVAHSYFFPLFIPAGSRIAARAQAQIASDTVVCRVNLFQRPMGVGWVGTRVTAYGVTSASSRGTTCTASGTMNTYGTAGTLSASTANGIKYMQVGMQGNSSAALTDSRVLADIRLGASTSIAGPLICNMDTGTESVGFSHANQQLQAMAFSLPSAQDLRVAVMSTVASQGTDFIVYGVD